MGNVEYKIVVDCRTTDGRVLEQEVNSLQSQGWELYEGLKINPVNGNLYQVMVRKIKVTRQSIKHVDTSENSKTSLL